MPKWKEATGRLVAGMRTSRLSGFIDRTSEARNEFGLRAIKYNHCLHEIKIFCLKKGTCRDYDSPSQDRTASDWLGSPRKSHLSNGISRLGF